MFDGENQFSLSVGDLMTAILLIFILLLFSIFLTMQNEFSSMEKQLNEFSSMKKQLHEFASMKKQLKELSSMKKQLEANDEAAKKIKYLNEVYKSERSRLYESLMAEFETDLAKWNAELSEETLTLRFKNTTDLFKSSKHTLQPSMKVILADFFPRYIRLLSNNKFRDDIAEIRIEGHTSSEWETGTSDFDAYLHNMALSQARTRSVLGYCLSQLNSTEFSTILPSEGISVREWTRYHLTANGLSSSHLIIENNKENSVKSRRVEFRVRPNVEKYISKIQGVLK
jgi:outer membrane protein OmpA-like peptidoglycan-associated protein